MQHTFSRHSVGRAQARVFANARLKRERRHDLKCESLKKKHQSCLVREEWPKGRNAEQAQRAGPCLDNKVLLRCAINNADFGAYKYFRAKDIADDVEFSTRGGLKTREE